MIDCDDFRLNKGRNAMQITRLRTLAPSWALTLAAGLAHADIDLRDEAAARRTCTHQRRIQ